MSLLALTGAVRSRVTRPLLKAKSTKPRRSRPRCGFITLPVDPFRLDESWPRRATWPRWLATAPSIDPSIPETNKPWDLSFREELHAIDAVVAGESIAMFSDIVVGRELKSGVLVKVHDLSLPGYGFYVVHAPNHPEQPSIDAFSAWLRSVT